MNLTQFFQKVIDHLNTEKIQYALAGGMVASLYRKTPRATHDIDLVIYAQDQPEEEEKIAQSIIRALDLEPHLLRKADLEGGPLFARKKKSTPIYIVAGRSSKETHTIGLDLILSRFPWAKKALVRAQENCVDFGFSPVPCLTVEDFVLSKLNAIENQSTRFMDLDDLKSIFGSDYDIDIEYLCNEMLSLGLRLPETIAPFAPQAISRVTQKKRR